MKLLRSTFASLALLAYPWIASADSPLGNADEINSGGGGGDLKETIIHITQQILQFMTIIAVVMIVIAGIWMIVGLGEESSKEKAKKIIIYTIIGLVLILIARAIVSFVIGTLS